MSNAIATIQSTGLTTSFDEDDITAILNELDNSAAFLARYLPKGAGTGFYSTFASLLGPLADLHDDLASAMAANHVSFGTAGGNPSLTFDLGGGSSVTLIVGSDILTQIAKSDADFLLAIEYAPSLGALDTLFRGTPFAGLKPSNVEIVASTQALTSARGVALNSGVSLVASFDIGASSDPFFQFVSGMLGVTTASAIVNVDGSQQSLSGEISVDKTIALGDLQISFDDLAFSIAMENSQPVFTASQTLTFADYDPTQRYEPDLVLKSGYQVDTSAVSIFGQLASANSVGWQNPFGIQGAVIRTVALETGFTYGPPPSVDSLGVVVDMKWGDYDYQLAFMADRTSPDRNAFALTLNKSVSLVQVFAQMSSVMLGPLAFALVANAGPLFNLIPLTVMSFDSDGDQALDPLISLAPIDTSIVDTTIAAGFEVNARIDLAGVTGQLSLKASADFTAMDGSLDIEALNIKDLLVISGVEPNTHLVANFHSAPGELSLNGNGKIALFGMTLAQADFSLSSSAVLIKKTVFNFGVVQFDIPLLSINFDTGAAEGAGEFNLFGQTLSESRFKITENQVHFDADMHFGSLLSFKGSVDWSTATQELVGHADVTINGTTLANAELLIKADGSVRISGTARMGIKDVADDVDVDIVASYDKGVAKLHVTAHLGALGDVSLTMAADANIAEEIYKQAIGGIGEQVEWVANAILDGITDLLHSGAFSYTVDQASDLYNDLVDTAGSWINAASGGKKPEKNLIIMGTEDGDRDFDLVGKHGKGVLNGNGGHDFIFGLGGVDVLVGFQGNDAMDGGADTDFLYGGGDNDMLNGGDGNDFVFGDDGHDKVFGGLGDDLVRGDRDDGGGSGDDEVHGGAGNDQVFGDAGSDVLWGDDGNDVLHGGNARFNTAGTEVNVLHGGSGDDHLIGGAGLPIGSAAVTNYLYGDSGNDRLEGDGDSHLIATNYLYGGDGNDTYIVRTSSDHVNRSFNFNPRLPPNVADDAGIDTVISSISSTLSAELENLTLATGAVNGTGNGSNNVLIGNAANNTLDGLAGDDTLDGGAGADKLNGGMGDDSYVVDNAGDVVTEAADSGIDTVNSAISYTLGAHLENLTLTGTAAINGTGNGLNNTMIGNAGNNSLTGGDGHDLLDGGAGADRLIGGNGNDVYIVDNVNDVVTETGSSPSEIDFIESSVSFTLGDKLEALVLRGAAAINAIGNELDNALTGNVAANTLDGRAGADRMVGDTGNDTYIVDNAGDTVTETSTLATEIDTVRSAVSFTLGDNVENLVLTGIDEVDGTGNVLDNSLIGNAATNILIGGDGDDLLDGGASSDVMRGDKGNDTYVVDHAEDVIFETSTQASEVDTVQSSVNFTLGDNLENLVLAGLQAIDGTGNALNNRLTGNAAANQLWGDLGNDVLDGGADADTLTGGQGNDQYIVDDLGDTVVEASIVGSGVDSVESSVDFTLGDNLENLTLAGAAFQGAGNALNNKLTGNDADNLLLGGLGNDLLDGGAGINRMQGGAGDDTYTVRHAARDIVVEVANEGTDTVISFDDFSLEYVAVENLELAGVLNIDGFGNGLDNSLLGNASQNFLWGGAGDDLLNGMAGADQMDGGKGNDLYVVDHLFDQVVEDSTADGGVDSVYSSVSFTLGADLENLTLTGTTAINGSGNDLNNHLLGNSAANTLRGAGGDDLLDGSGGADAMYGGDGNDRYGVDNQFDKVFEGTAANGGIDTVVSSVSFALGDCVENLSLGGDADIDGSGNELANSLTGNAATNNLLGGAGDDTLNGGAGHDILFGDDVFDELAGDDWLDGGTGADYMQGGRGKDTYVVDNVGDVILDDDAFVVPPAVNEVDTVLSSVDFTLGSRLEVLTLTGAAAINGTGNGLANTLTGNAVANLLNGLGGNDVLDGGAGSDTLTGGTGADVFIQALGNTGVDTLTDFGAGDSLKFNGFTLSAAQNAGNLLLSVHSVDGLTTLDVSSASAPAELATVRLQGSFAGQAFAVSGSVVTLAAATPNVAPSGADKVVSMLEDARYVFVAADFGFSDAADSNPDTLASVIVTTTPLNGVVTLNGSAVAAGQAVTAADIAAGLLAYAPTANASGLGLGSFTFQVQDNGGTANGGINTDTTPNTLRLDVQEVDDAAVLGSANVSVQETSARLSVGGVLSISDLDSAASFVAQPSTAGQYGVFNIGSNGLWTYQANLTFDHLNPGDSLKDSFRVTSSDGTATHVAVTIVGTAETSTVHLGDAPLRQTGTGGQWAQAWTQTGYNIQHKADHINAAEAWSKLTFSGVSSQLLSGGDISAGDLGVSAQSAATSTVKQEIDGKEALRIVVPGAADSVTIKLSGLFAHDDGSTMNESGVLRLLDAAGHLVAEQVFVADALDGRKTITLAAAGGFASMELLAGAYDAQDHFVYGGYTPEGGGAAVAVATDALGKAHGSDFLLHSADFTVALMGVPA